MGTVQRHTTMIHPLLCALLIATVVTGGATAAYADDRVSTDPVEGLSSQDLPRQPRPGGRTMPNPWGAPAPVFPGTVIEWPPPPWGEGLRGVPVPLYDNGEQLNDFGDPATQLSLMDDGAPIGFEFSAAVADDFILPESITQPGANFQITTIRAPFAFFINNVGIDPDATPSNTWTMGIYVTVYGNDPLDAPGGAPNGDGSVTGDVIHHVLIPSPPGGWNETPVAGCRTCFVVDIPVDLTLPANTRYWLSLVPRHPTGGALGLTQSAWCLSDQNHLLSAQRGASFDFPFWTEIEGNVQAAECTNPLPPPPATIRNVSFQIFGQEVPPTTGACCDTMTSLCADVVDPSLCNAPTEQFHSGQLCQFLSPPCNQGACCLSDGAGGGICTLMTEVDCLADPDFIDFVPGVECPINCTPPPPNDDCAAPIGLLGPSVSIPFDSIRASIDPASPTPGCGAITGDVWYTYQAPCNGTVVITTSGSSFDTLLAVYGNNTPVCPPCPTDNSNELACNDDFDAATTASQVIVPVTFADCLLIRVGGNGLGATGGPGMLTIDCVNTGFGACCDPVTRTCTETMVGGCSPPSVFNPGDVCSELSCPAAPANDDCVAAEVLSGNGLSIPFDTTFATTDPAGPTTFCQGPGGEDLVQDIWFSYTAACTGDVLINTQGSAYDTFIAVYDFSAGAFCPDGNICLILTALSDVACNDDMPGGGTDSEVVVPGVLAGDCLMIRVGGKDLGLGASGGMGILNIGCLTANDGACCDLATRTCTIADAAGCPPPNQFTLGTICSPVVCPQAPANDLCADAEPLNGSVLLAYDTTLATTPPAGPSTACGLPVQDIWYSYSVPCTGNVIIHTAGSGYDTFLAVYDMNGGSGCPDPALCPILADSELDCNDDFLFNPFSQINVAANAGDCLLIRVGGKDLGLGASGGPGLLTIACVPAGMGACCHADRSCDDLQTPANCVAAGDQFTAGDICSDWTCPPIPANDPCTSAIAIGDGNHPFHTLLTTTDGPPGVPPACAAELTQDIWFSYDATCTGTLTLSLCGHVDYDAAIEVYDGCACPADFANLIACDDNGCGPGGASEVILPVFMGNCYLIRVGGAGGAAGFGLLSVTCGTATACCPGDLNGDGVLDDTDATGLVAALLNPPMSNTPEFCAADVNEDLFVDGLDIQTFVNQLLAGTGCPPLVSGACCFSDGTCSAGSEADCVGMGGVYQGNSTSCMPNLCPQPPVNDACLNALLLPCNTQMTIDNLLSSTEPTDPVLSCRFPSPGQGVGTVWFTFVATDTDALITTCNTASPVSDTIVTVYDSAVCPVSMMNEIACSEDAGGACGRLSQACATGLVVGQTYTILVASFDDASRGAITVELTCPCPRGACCLPDGSCLDVRSDECLALDGVFQGDGVSCTPNPCAPPPLVMDCCAGDLDGSGGVETGDMAGFVAALLNPPLLGTPDFCHADVNADLVVDGADIADFIPLVIGAVACAPPANDTCLNALTVACDTRVIVDNTLAATDAADPAFSCRAGGAGQGAGSLWFSFVATDVDARINTCGSIHPANDTILAVYDGANCAMLGTELGCSEDAGGLCGRLSDLCVGGLVPGNTYFVQIASFDEASRGFISVDVTCPCP